MDQMIVFGAAALVSAACMAWVLRAYVRAPAEGAELPKAGAPLALAAAAALAAIGLYVLVGRPDLPDAPYASRLAEVKAKVEQAPDQLTPEEYLTVLAERAKQAPDDPKPHLFTGQILLRLGRPADAAQAYEAALRRAPEDNDALLGLGRSLLLMEEGGASADALSVLTLAAERAPADPRPTFLLALADPTPERFAVFRDRVLAEPTSPETDAALEELGSLLRGGLRTDLAAGLLPTFEALAAARPGEGRWAFFRALTAAQAEDPRAAGFWRAFRDAAPEDDPRRAMADAMIQQLERPEAAPAAP